MRDVCVCVCVVLKMCVVHVTGGQEKGGGGKTGGYGLASVCRGWPYMAVLPWAAQLTCDGIDGYFRLRKFNLLIPSH